jgi:hypothetical protein
MVHDNVDRDRSTDPDVHRDLVVVDPPMLGKDVANANRGTRARLLNRGLADDVPVPAHDMFTHAAAIAAVEALYFLGALQDTYLKTQLVDGHPRLVLTMGSQTILRDPERRTSAQLERAKDRRGQLDRGPRYYDDLAKEDGVKGGGKGAKAALAFAVANIGVHENPAGSNWGGKVEQWIRLAGYIGPVPWCGCFSNACVMAGGVPSGAGWIGYTPAIITHAQRRTGGWSWHANGAPGDLALFDTAGGDPAVHVGVVEKPLRPGVYQTIEGNTSKGDGSQSDGGIVARRERTTTGSFRIVGFARPPW